MEPKLRFPEFEGNWEATKFGELIDIANGQVDPKVEPYASMPHIAPDNIESRTGKLKNVRSACEDGVISGKYEFDEKALVYSKIRPNLSKVAKPGYRGICSADMYPIWAKADRSDTGFLFHLMLGEKFVSDAIAVSMRTGLPKINRPDLNAIRTHVPKTIPEQQKIAAFLDAASKKIALLTEKRDGLVAYKRGVMQRLFSGALRFTRPDGSAFPDWEYFSLDDLEAQGNVELGRGQVISKADLRAHPGNYPVYSSSGVDDGEFGRYGKWMFDEELITWSIDGGGRFFHRKCGKFSITNVSGFLRILNSEPNYGYLYSALSFLHQRLVFDYQLKAHPSVIRKLYKRIPIPHPDEQTKIAEALSALDAKIDAVSAENSQMETFKKGLLQKMFV